MFGSYTLINCSFEIVHQASASARTLKSQTLAATPFSGHMKILYTQIGMGSAAVASTAALLWYYGKVT